MDRVVITHDVGLHARPSVKLTKLAKGFHRRIEIAGSEAGPWIDAKSIVKVMAMKAKQNTDAVRARQRRRCGTRRLPPCVDLVTRDFDEAGDHGAA